MDQDRPDVATFFKRSLAQPLGFTRTLNVTGLPPGTYSLRVYRRTATGWIGCRGPNALFMPKG